MKMHNWAIPLILGVLGWTAACGSIEGEGVDPGGRTTVDGPIADGDEVTGTSFVERELWLALAEEPTWHLNAAREKYLNGDRQGSSQELTKVAAILNFESRHSHSPREEGLLLASVQELREVATRVLSVQELDRVTALVLRIIAAHQVALARDALEAGDGRMAGRYITETATSIEAGFQRGGVEEGSAIASVLQAAREVANRLEFDGNGSPAEGRRTLDDLDSAVKGLSQVLTQGRK